MVESLGDGLRFRIVTADRDLGAPEPYSGVMSGVWSPVGKAEVRYLGPGERGVPALARLIREEEFDHIYLNSFFDPRFSILPLAIRRVAATRGRVVIAPRGEFSRGALSLKPAKKRAFILASRLSGFHRRLTWHASSEHEAEDIRSIFGHVADDIRVAPPIPRWPSLRERQSGPRPPGAPLRIVFLARISPMKNLLFAIDVLSKVRAPVEFSIIGPVEDEEYWGRCRMALSRLPSNVAVLCHGTVRHEDVEALLLENDLLFLPTMGENFGHSIAEALAAGLRVLLSDQTMWRDLAREGVGHDLPLGLPSAFVQAIESEAERCDCGDQATISRDYLSRKLQLDQLRLASLELFSA
ncbi:MAG: glycosyltransferase family 4 protein [Rhizobiaceae bacterium]|nr:glycosyltransferase family 4 protein [Rhizobiaceae bacterium]